MKVPDLDGFLQRLAYKIHPRIGRFYASNSTLQQFAKFSFVAFVFGYLLNLPLMVLFTDVFHIWYGVSLLLAAFIVHTAKFAWNKLWVFKSGSKTKLEQERKG